MSYSLPALELIVALRKESVDRNLQEVTIMSTSTVALRKESVDRNRRCLYRP